MVEIQTRMPVLFFGHGNPINALEKNAFTEAWSRLGQALPRPRAIVAVSAHWVTRKTAVSAQLAPATIHDFGGFPPELFAVQYPAPGHPELAAEIASLLAPTPVALDLTWGLDHGTWSVLVHVFPAADIPVVQLSLAARASPAEHYRLGQALAPLRRQGILIVGSGNVVHNLAMMRWQPGATAYPWSVRFEDFVRKRIEQGDHQALIDFEATGDDGRLSVPTPEHFLPLLYCLGLIVPEDRLAFPTLGINAAAISMLSVSIGM